MQKGATLYYAVTIMLVMLAIAMGLSTVILYQIKNINAASDGVLATAAAYSGVEKGLYVYYKTPGNVPTNQTNECGEDPPEYRSGPDGNFYLIGLPNKGAYRWFCNFIPNSDPSKAGYGDKRGLYIKSLGDYNGVRKPVSGEW